MMVLADVVKRWRLMRDLSLRQAASEIGVSAATLMRFEQGRNKPDGDTLSTVLRWLLSERKGKR